MRMHKHRNSVRRTGHSLTARVEVLEDALTPDGQTEAEREARYPAVRFANLLRWAVQHGYDREYRALVKLSDEKLQLVTDAEWDGRATDPREVERLEAEMARRLDELEALRAMSGNERR